MFVSNKTDEFIHRPGENPTAASAGHGDAFDRRILGGESLYQPTKPKRTSYEGPGWALSNWFSYQQ